MQKSIIIGKRYGTITGDGMSVTHREFSTARDNDVAMITFVDAEVLNYKKVFDVDPAAAIWNNFKEMDQPRSTFALIKEVYKAPTFNGVIPFSTASEAKHGLKQQIAHYVGDRLAGVVRPIKAEVSEILAEVKTLRSIITQSETIKQPGTGVISDSDRYYNALRFLLEERQRDYTRFVEALFGDLDVAVKYIVRAEDLNEVLAAAGATLKIIPDEKDFKAVVEGEDLNQLLSASHGEHGVWALHEGKKVLMNTTMKNQLDDQQRALRAKLREKAEKRASS